jgi:hypothetical protein
MRQRASGRLVLGLVIAVVIAAAATVVAETGPGGITITEIAMASSMLNGVPETTATSFPRTGGWIYCFVRLENPSAAETSILVSFERATSGDPAAGATGTPLAVPARPRYRTFARTGSHKPAGSYRCVVRDSAGSVLESTPFEITE